MEYQRSLEKRKQVIELLNKKILQTLLTDVEKYFLWSAESGSSIFDFAAGRVARNKTTNEKPKADDWDSIWKVLRFSKRKRKKSSLEELRQPLIELKARLKHIVSEFLKTKNNLINIAKEISDFVRNKALTVFQYKKTINMLNWIREVLLLMISNR